MKRKIALVVLALGVCNCSVAQTDTLLSSLGYDKTDKKSPYGRELYPDIVSEYPDDLRTSSLFFIELCVEDTEGNYAMGNINLFQKTSEDLVSKFKAGYPYKFDSFSNDYKYKGKGFFVEQGYKYRLLIHTKWEWTSSGFSNPSVWKKRYAITIESLENGTVYGSDKWYWSYNYVKKFLKLL